MKKVAIVGAGIVGATAAYYLSKEADIEVTVFDHGHGQATKAAAGIISPWFSKRRNKAWYKICLLYTSIALFKNINWIFDSRRTWVITVDRESTTHANPPTKDAI